MPTFIKTGYWDKLSKAPKGYLNLDDVIKGDVLRSVTKSEFDALVSSNGLVPGEFYEISGVDIELYGGTTIIMQAVTNNKLGIEGYGVFYNPKYNQDVAGYGIWDNYINVNITNVVNGPINTGSEIIANTGGLAYYISDYHIQYISGNWNPANVTSIQIVDYSSCTGDIEVASIISYPIGTRVIWGGKHWDNLTGEVGTALDKYTLDSVNWQVIPYNSTDYNVAVDIIKYNQEVDEIFSREDRVGNVVEGYLLNND